MFARDLRRWWWMQRARLALALGFKSHAIDCLARLPGVMPRAPGPRLHIAAIAAELGDPGRAESEVLQAIAIDPHSAVARCALGRLLEQRDALAEAEAHFRSAVELDAKLAPAWFGLGICLVRQGRQVEALLPFEECTRLEPGGAQGWFELARTHLDLGHLGEARGIVARLESFAPRLADHLRREFEVAATFDALSFENTDRSHGWR